MEAAEQTGELVVVCVVVACWSRTRRGRSDDDDWIVIVITVGVEVVGGSLSMCLDRGSIRYWKGDGHSRRSRRRRGS